MIKIDMEMPRSCDECPINSKYKHLCKITKKSTWSKGYGGISLKNDDCPWVECENEKSCETRKHTSIGYCNISGCENMDKWGSE